jgi:hypothetical protein
MSRLFVVASALFVLAACGGTRAGDKCTTTGFLCQDSATALECKVGAWVALPCKGSNGCKRTTDLITCDMSGNEAGDLCASTAEAKGICTKDGLGTLECRDGALVKTNTCRSCSISGDTVVCQP